MNKQTGQGFENKYATVEGSPGEGARLTGFFKATWPWLVVFSVGGYLLRAAWPQPPLSQFQAGILFLILAGCFACMFIKGQRRLHQFLKGARGEEMVARTLGFLPAGYYVFHGVAQKRNALGGAHDFDHVVIGPSGIFVIETKNWQSRISVEQGRILYDGHEPDRSPLDQVKVAASELERALHQEDIPVTVQPVLCFATRPVEGGTQGVSGVIVCGMEALHQQLLDGMEAPLPAPMQEAAAKYVRTLSGTSPHEA